MLSAIDVKISYVSTKLTTEHSRTTLGRNKAISSITLGFVTPSTNIAHNKLKSEIAELMNFCFNCGNNARLGAMWKNSKIIVCI